MYVMILRALSYEKLVTSRSAVMRCAIGFTTGQQIAELRRHLHTKDAWTIRNNPPLNGTNKVTIVGAGAVGAACANTLLAQAMEYPPLKTGKVNFFLQGVTNSLCLIDAAEEKAKGEMIDLQHASVFTKNAATITAGSDYTITRGSRVCIITAGVRFSGKSRLNSAKANAELMKTIVPQLAKHSPDAILLMVTNPVDIMTYVAWKLTGFPKHRIIGSGTSLDTARFHFFMSQKMGISVSDCHGWIIGEHGDSSVPVWSGVNFGGVRLQDLKPNAGLSNDEENWADVHNLVVKGAHEVRNRKGYTNWAVALCIAAITNSVLSNNGEVHAVSVHAQGLYGIKEDVFVSLPSIIGGDGVHNVVKLKLADSEWIALQKSAQILAKAQASVGPLSQ